MIQVALKSIHCHEETDEVGADEPYVLVTAVNLAALNVTIPRPNFEVVRYGPFEDFDDEETQFAAGLSESFWGMTGRPETLTNPDDIAFIVALVENDDGDPEVLRGLLRSTVSATVLGLLGLPNREARIASLIREVNSVLRAPTGFPNIDEPIGPPQELRYSPEELAAAEAGQAVIRTMNFEGDGGRYELTFEARNTGQADWRFCNKCSSMFFDGFPTKGVCPAAGGHTAQGLNFSLPHDIPETAREQAAWRFCGPCHSLFFDGFSNKGACPVGRHEAAGFQFVLPHDVPDSPNAQGAWRFCHKCNSMFFDGFPNKGVCRAGGGHEAAGFQFVLPHDIPDSPNAQGAWRFCHKCHIIFFDGFAHKGACPAGGGHEAAGFNFVLPHDLPESPNTQQAWRFCHRCNAMFFDGFPGKGACPTGGHQSVGFNFVLPHDIPQTRQSQVAWRFCHKCQVMFFDGFPNKGVCRAGGSHEAAGFNFVLDHRL